MTLTYKLKERKMAKLALLPSNTIIPMFIQPIEPAAKPVISLNEWDKPEIRPLGVLIEYRRKGTDDIVILPEGSEMIYSELEPKHKFDKDKPFIAPTNY